jgi:UDP-glucose 4-epimerase
VYLSQALRLAGRPTVAVAEPLVNATAALLRRSGRVDFSPEQLSFLRYGRVGDITRMRAGFGYEPRYSTRDALLDFVRTRTGDPLFGADTALRWEASARSMLVRAARTLGEAREAP